MTLDAMRGIAALLIVTYHVEHLALPIATNGHLAVDFFFVLSGLVIARTYDAPMQAGMRARDFLRVRFVRLYPMFALGIILAGLKGAQEIIGQTYDALPVGQAAYAFLSEMLAIPAWTDRAMLFPLNGPAWSLFFEALINIAFAFVLVRLSPRKLMVVSGLGAVAVMVAAFGFTTLNVGWSWDNSSGGLARVLSSFTAGILIHRLGLATRQRTTWLAVLPLLAMAFLLMHIVTPEERPYYDSAVAVLAAPILVTLGAWMQPPAVLRRLCTALGDLSYPLYATHFSFIFLYADTARALGISPYVWEPILLAALAGFAFVLGRWVDPKLRRWLGRMMERGRAQGEATLAASGPGRTIEV